MADISKKDNLVAWQDLSPRKRMKHLLNTGHRANFNFFVYSDEGKRITIKCHKFILMCASPIFERMFEADFHEVTIFNHIVVNDIKANDFQKFIEYLYWPDIQELEKCTFLTLQNLLFLSKKYMVSTLKQDCLSVIRTHIEKLDATDSLHVIYKFAQQIDEQQIISQIDLKIRQKRSYHLAWCCILALILFYCLFIAVLSFKKN